MSSEERQKPISTPATADDDPERPGSDLQPEYDLSRCTTLDEASKSISGTRWYWERWLPRGYISLLVGYPGEGKSYLALEVAALLLKGAGWPDGQRCEKVENVMWIDTEGTQGLLIERAKKLRMPLDRILLPSRDPLEDFRLDNGKQREELRQRVLEARPGLVVVDTLRGAYHGEENSSDTVSSLLKDLQTLARLGQMAVLVLHHLKKPSEYSTGAEVTMHSIRGSSAIPATARIVWAIDDPPGPIATAGMKRLRVVKSNLARWPEPLGFLVDGEGIHWKALPPDSKRKGAVENAVTFLTTTLKDGPKPSTALVEEAANQGISTAALNRAKSILGVRAKKESSERGQWVWELPSPKPDPE